MKPGPWAPDAGQSNCPTSKAKRTGDVPVAIHAHSSARSTPSQPGHPALRWPCSAPDWEGNCYNWFNCVKRWASAAPALKVAIVFAALSSCLISFPAALVCAVWPEACVRLRDQANRRITQFAAWSDGLSQMPHNYPTNWRQQGSRTFPTVCLLIHALITATYRPCEAQHSKCAFELLSESALLQDRRTRFSLGISAVNHYHKIARQEFCFNKIKGKNKYCACLGIADSAVQSLH